MLRQFMILALVVVLLDGALSAKCQCNCPTGQLVCAKDLTTKELATFKNPCSLGCYNCTHDKMFQAIKQGECSNIRTRRSDRGLLYRMLRQEKLNELKDIYPSHTYMIEKYDGIIGCNYHPCTYSKPKSFDKKPEYVFEDFWQDMQTSCHGTCR